MPKELSIIEKAEYIIQFGCIYKSRDKKSIIFLFDYVNQSTNKLYFSSDLDLKSAINYFYFQIKKLNK